MLPFIRLGPFLLQAPGLALLVGLWVGSWFAEAEARRLGLNAAHVNNLIYYGLIAGILGARLTYAARFLDAYVANPAGLLALTPATLDVNAGLLIGTATAIAFGQRWKLPLRATLDALAPGLAMFLIAIGVAHFLSGDAFGAPAQLPWSIYLWDDYRHPTQIYETLAAVGIFLVVWKLPLDPAHKGLKFLFLVALSSAARVFLEAFRGDSTFWLNGFRAAQVVGLLIVGFSLWMMRRWVGPVSAPSSARAPQEASFLED